MENEFDVEDISNTSSDSVAETEEFIELDNSDDEVDYRAKAEAEAEARKKAEELARNYKIRAEKAEKAKEAPKTETKTDSLSPADLIAVVEEKVSSEDLEDVMRFAKFENVTVKDALKSPIVKAILREKQEVRTSAQAANTSNAKRSSTKTSDQSLLDRASKGELPEDEDSIKRLVSLYKK